MVPTLMHTRGKLQIHTALYRGTMAYSSSSTAHSSLRATVEDLLLSPRIDQSSFYSQRERLERKK